MAKLHIAPDSTDVTVMLFIQDSSATDGSGLTGLVYNTASLTCYYARPLAAGAQLTLATLASVTTAHTDGGFIEVDATNLPGVYRLDLSDTMVAAGVPNVAVMLKGAANMVPCLVELQLDLQAAAASGMRLGTVTGTPSATVFLASDITDATADVYNARVVMWLTGALAGQAGIVADYEFSTPNGQFTVAANTFTGASSSGDKFIVI